ncbi:hypothetical protein [Vibrio sp. 1CM23M]|uniref:hypothetical protein n=1 Tax=Vibrio sp. 1CM23M TaxID=2929164 RepID=UPI0020C00F48|nr:hypothetical protein [Vibrio sp. 1CM23M]MCK8072433.1 hypothetical protein [Vibrio sp. 1CM23M]
MKNKKINFLEVVCKLPLSMLTAVNLVLLSHVFYQFWSAGVNTPIIPMILPTIVCLALVITQITIASPVNVKSYAENSVRLNKSFFLTSAFILMGFCLNLHANDSVSISLYQPLYVTGICWLAISMFVSKYKTEESLYMNKEVSIDLPLIKLSSEQVDAIK